jgi:hypothetical protein
MPIQNRTSTRALELVAAKGGSIWTTCTNTVAGGAALARTEIENMYVPDKAKTLLGWRPMETPAISAAAESVVSVFDISGGNYNWQPQEVICGCVSDSCLAATGQLLLSQSEYYDVYAPVAGGEQISIGVEPCDAIAGDRRSGAEFTWTDVRIGLPVIRSQCSREVALPTATAGIVAGTTLPITNAHELIEVGGIATHVIAFASEELNVTLILKCSALPVNEIRCMFEGTGQINVATPGAITAYLTRRLQRLKFSQPSATIYADFDVDVAIAAANVGQMVHYIRWT